MRVLIVHPGPNFSVADVFNGWREALNELGCTVGVYNMHDRIAFYEGVYLPIDDVNEDSGTDDEAPMQFRKACDRDQALTLAAGGLMAACYQFWPDVVLIISGFFTPPSLLDILRARKHKLAIVHTEAPYQDQMQLQRAAHVDVNLVNDPLTLDAYRDVSAAAEYVPHAYRPSLHRPGRVSPRYRSDFAFVGTGYEHRIEFFERMNLEGINVLLGGNWTLADPHMVGKRRSPLVDYLAHPATECMDNDQAVKVYRSAKVGINLYRREAETPEQANGWAMGPREVEMAACGLFYLRDPRPEGNNVFKGILPTFTTPEEAGEQLRFWLARDELRNVRAEQARAAIADRTFTRNAKRMLHLVEGL